MRLDKFLAQSAVGNRKMVRIYIKEGKVTVNGEVIMEPYADIDEKADAICYGEKTITYVEKTYYMFHKPEGCITARLDSRHKTVLDYFDTECMEGIFPIGRLDKDTEGLLLLTNDGEFDHELMHPEAHVSKTYYFLAYGEWSEEDRHRLERGISIGMGEALTKPAKLVVETEISAAVDNPNYRPIVSGHLTISEGRKHQVKRMLASIGCRVFYLKRTAIGGLILDKTLKKGEYRKLTEIERDAACLKG